jgi:Amidohydrolase family
MPWCTEAVPALTFLECKIASQASSCVIISSSSVSRSEAALKFVLIAIVLCTSLALAQAPPIGGTAILHVTVINVATGAKLPDQTVTLQGTRIRSVAPTKTSDTALPGAIDAHGDYLIPGLWDMHVHVHDTAELPLYIANGVTGIRVMSGEKNTSAYRAELGSQPDSPWVYLASAIVDGPSPLWPGSYSVRNAAEARRAVGEIKASGADFIKVYTGVPRDAYLALVSEAKQQHIDFEGHLPDALTAQEASALGQRSIEHLLGIAVSCSKNQNQLMTALARVQFFRDRLEIQAQGYNNVDADTCRALFDDFRRNQTWQVPTLTVLRMWGSLDDSRFTSDPRLAYIDRKSRDRWQERIQPQIRRWNFAEYQLARGVFAADQRVVGVMSRNGVPLMAGTDAMNPFCFPGFSLHDELALMVDSGLTPLAALQAATINPVKFLGRTVEQGSIEPGKLASLVLLRADPLADIHNTTQIESVWLSGRLYDHAAILRLLDSARESAKHK